LNSHPRAIAFQVTKMRGMCLYFCHTNQDLPKE
jgi:hypothetical protein